MARCWLDDRDGDQTAKVVTGRRRGNRTAGVAARQRGRDCVCDTLAALRLRFSKLGKHLKDPLAGVTSLLLENGGSDTAELEPGFDRRMARVI